MKSKLAIKIIVLMKSHSKNHLIVMKIIIILSVCFFALSCKTNQKPKITTILFSEVENFNLFSNKSLELLSYIPLETAGSPIVNSTSKMIEYNNTYYFFDQFKMVVYRFDKYGKFLNKIGSKGRGPTEYSRVEDFCIDPANGNVEFLSLTSQQIYQYTKEDTYISKIKIEGYPYSFTKFDNGMYLFCKGQVEDKNSQIGKAQLYISDNTGNIKETYLPIEKNTAFLTPLRDESIQVTNGKIFFKTWFTGDVYEITKKGPIHTVTIDFKDKAYSKDLLTKTTEEFMQFLNSINPFNIDKYLENENYIYSFIMDAKAENSYHLLYSKKSCKTIITKASRDNSNNAIIGSAKRITPTDELHFLIDPITLLDLRNTTNNSFNSSLDVSFLTENSNSVLVKFKIRSF